MPVVFRDGAIIYYFYSNEGVEPIHIHVRKGGPTRPEAAAKFWLDPIAEEYSDGFTPAEKRRIKAQIRAREEDIRRAWAEHFGA